MAHKPRFLVLLIAVVLVLATTAEATPAPRWPSSAGFEQIAQVRGVKVYKDPKADIIRLAAEGRLPAPPHKVQKVLLDYEHQIGVIDRLSESRVLNRGFQWLLVYQRLNLPIISDRDFTLMVRWGGDMQHLWIRYQAMTNRGPPVRRGVERVSNHFGIWELLPISGGQETLARLQVTIDLAGWLPKWLARAGSGKELPRLFEAICRLLLSREKENRACL